MVYMAFRKAYLSVETCSLRILAFLKNGTIVFKDINFGLLLYLGLD